MFKQGVAPVGNIDELLDWLKQFERQTGRPLRVLHIGNIANNAYNNARIQRAHGIEADVLCYDYYHVMSTPEWEDGALTTPVDPNLPDWWSTNLGGFKRPSWFVQGPAEICIKYLDALSKQQTFRTRLWRWALDGSYWNLVKDRATVSGVRRQIHSRCRGIKSRLDSMFLRLGALAQVLDPLSSIDQRLAPAKSFLRDRIIVPLIIVENARPRMSSGGSIIMSISRMLQRMRRFSGRHDLRSLADSETAQAIVSNFSPRKIFSDSVSVAVQVCTALIIHLLLLPVQLLLGGKKQEIGPARRKEMAQELVAKVRHQDANVSDDLWEQFGDYLRKHALRFGPVLSSYDIVQGYSIDGIIPLAAGHTNFCCYEHGTLREIPFEQTLLGLICRLAYKNAPCVFITNSDVVVSVDRLALERTRVCCLPHAFDDLKLDIFRASNPAIIPDSETVRFFCPSRQHWRDQDPSLTKGSDLMLKAAAEVAAEGHQFKLTLVEWGVDVEASRQLIRKLGLERLISWVPPMDKRALWKEYCRSHAVLDQFSLAALGGVGFETLALGRRLITKIDVEQLKSFFGCAPPVLPASNQSEIAGSIRSVILDPDDVAEIGQAGRQWIKDYHSARRIVALQANAYRHLLEPRTSGGVL
jgi:glycosyltransferase involved in cell wall biosynthesis